jgi:formylglycine-generating enzyme required for sulfatase activity
MSRIVRSIAIGLFIAAPITVFALRAPADDFGPLPPLPPLPPLAPIGSTHTDPPPQPPASHASSDPAPPHAAPTPTPIDKMIRIPKASATLGVHEWVVELASYDIDANEVSVAKYDACVTSGACTAAKRGGYCNDGVSGRDQHPINCVDAEQAAAFCKSVGKRLPTEDEWEYAARGPSIFEHFWPWGFAPAAAVGCVPHSSLGERTCPVGANKRDVSSFGLYDMASNVLEWTSSSMCDTCEPKQRIARGGEFPPEKRIEREPSAKDDDMGFRCARDVTAYKPQGP